MRFLFGCHALVASGALLRLERVGAVLRRLGHQCAYVAFSPGAEAEFASRFPVLTFEEAAASKWDATLIPGAGFPDQTLDAFARLRAPRFGVRVQMILNDQHVRPRFLRVNEVFDPDLVIFNNEHWPRGLHQGFHAKAFHHLIGAVDTDLFRPQPTRPSDGRFVIGAQISKNPGPVIEALAQLPPDCIVRFFGFDRMNILAEATWRSNDRIEHAGPLFGDDLAGYYRGLNAMVSTEQRAGWANVVAEAMAAGAPAITTRAGTLSIARNEITALVIDHAEPAIIARSVLQLKNDTALAQRLALNARRLIEAYDWRDYVSRLVAIIDDTKNDARVSMAATRINARAPR